MNHHGDQCPFCAIDPSRVVAGNALAFVIRDGFPVTVLHSLVIPRRHAAGYFDLTADEVRACHELLGSSRLEIQKMDSSVVAFNVGINVGSAAGQTVNHCHIHLIPRREGDVPNPRGGIRHTIPGKGDY